MPGTVTDASFPWIRRKVLSGETIVIAKLSDRPAEAGRDRESFCLFGTKSNVLVPLSAGGGPPFGLLIFVAMREERDWPETIVRGFQLIAQVFASSLVRPGTNQRTNRWSEGI